MAKIDEWGAYDEAAASGTAEVIDKFGIENAVLIAECVQIAHDFFHDGHGTHADFVENVERTVGFLAGIRFAADRPPIADSAMNDDFENAIRALLPVLVPLRQSLETCSCQQHNRENGHDEENDESTTH